MSPPGPLIAHALEKFRADLPGLQRATADEDALWVVLMRRAEAIVDLGVNDAEQEQAVYAVEALFVEAGLKDADEPG
jgi:hypothetical protein